MEIPELQYEVGALGLILENVDLTPNIFDKAVAMPKRDLDEIEIELINQGIKIKHIIYIGVNFDKPKKSLAFIFRTNKQLAKEYNQSNPSLSIKWVCFDGRDVWSVYRFFQTSSGLSHEDILHMYYNTYTASDLASLFGLTGAPNHDHMILDLNESEKKLLKSGIEPNNIIYIHRNGRGSDNPTLGAFAFEKQDAIESICHSPRICQYKKYEHGKLVQSTTYECFCLDGRNIQSVKDALKQDFEQNIETGKSQEEMIHARYKK